MSQNLSTLPAKQSALPSPWIDKLFMRFSGMYGRHWAELWSGIPVDQIKAVWSQDLAGCTAEQIRHALDHCKSHLKFPPTCPEFVSLCREFREKPQNVAYLPAPVVPMPAATAKKLNEFVDLERKRDCKAWARKILANPGDYPWISRQFAEEALGIVHER